MSRTDLDAATLARSLRSMAGDGSMEWCHEPMQTSVLLDIADMLDENAKLREHIADLWEFGFSKNAGANSIKEYLRKVDELRDRTYELLGVAK